MTSIAAQIILFGSRAAGCASEESDFDLLCVGDGQRVRAHKLHILWISLAAISNPKWLETEIGGHIAEYGLWLVGSRTVDAPRPASPETISLKLHKVRDRSHVLADKWTRLSSHFRAQEKLKLRRDVQRLEVLRAGDAVPPSPILDRRWGSRRQKRLWSLQVLSEEPALGELVACLLFSSTGSMSLMRSE